MGWNLYRALGFLTNHRLVTMALAKFSMLLIGRGRWALPKSLLNDLVLLNKIIKLGITVTKKINSAVQDP